MKVSQLHILWSLLSQLTHGQIGELYNFPGAVTSLESGSLDLFVTDTSGNLFHRYHGNTKSGWNKAGFLPMNMTVSQVGKRYCPSVVTLGNQVHVFVNSRGDLVHRYLDSYEWKPPYDKDDELFNGWEALIDINEVDNDIIDGSSNLAVTARGSDRIHIVAKTDEGQYIHKYYDGTAWKPDGNGTSENLGTDGFDDEFFTSDPAVNSWGPDRLDIFGTLYNGTLLHKYWDGHQWQPSAKGWEQWGDNIAGTPIVTSWGKDRLDVWAARQTRNYNVLQHRYWDGSRLSEWEQLNLTTEVAPSVVHWGSNRIDIFSAFRSYIFHLFWDGKQWNPTDDEDPDDQSEFFHNPQAFRALTKPIAATWGKDNLNLFVLSGNSLKWQLWDGSQWKPKHDDYYDLGEIKAGGSKSTFQSLKQLFSDNERKSIRANNRKHSKYDDRVAETINPLLVQDAASLDL